MLAYHTITETISSLLGQEFAASISYFSCSTSLAFSFSGVFVLLGKMSWEEESGGEGLSPSDSEASCKRQHSLADNRH